MFCRLVVTCFLTITPAALFSQAQPSRSGVYGGAAVELGTDYEGGVQVGAYVNAPFSHRVGLRVDLNYLSFFGPDFSGGDISGSGPALKVFAATIGVAYSGQAPTVERHLTWILGGGFYRLNQDEAGGYHTVAGWHARISAPLGRKVSLEFGYNGLINSNSTKGFFPIAIAFAL